MGIAASVALQTIHYPVSLVQDIHYRSLANFDGPKRPRARIVQSLWVYMDTYEKTSRAYRPRAIRFDGWGLWLYRNFSWNTLRQLPSTSVGLVIFELVRKRYGSEVEAATIEKDGYSIILTETSKPSSGVAGYPRPWRAIGAYGIVSNDAPWLLRSSFYHELLCEEVQVTEESNI
ncbi:MAG: hypothetical protein Q9177_004397 [Variospora cf. flavescens]